MDWDFHLIAGPYNAVTEGPAWDGETLLFSVIQQSRICRYDPRTGAVTDFRKYTNFTNGLAFSPDGELYGCQGGSRRIVRFNKDGSLSKLADRLDGAFHNRPNDLAIDAQGRIWFSDPIGSGPSSGQQPLLDHASVLRLTENRGWTLQRMTYDTTGPNGVLVSPDGNTLYVAESIAPAEPRELRAYPIKADGSLASYKTLHTFGNDQDGSRHRGVDGMCLDADGNIVACAGSVDAGPGPMIYVFSPTGRVLETHPVPVDRPTNCTYGGPDLATLYVTTVGGHLFEVQNTGRKGWLIWPN